MDLNEMTTDMRDEHSLAASVVGRAVSLFAEDVRIHEGDLRSAIAGARVLVIGGGGSIGSITSRLLLQFAPRCLHVIDTSENYLADFVRDVRNGEQSLSGIDLRTLPIDFGGPIMHRLLHAERPYDLVLNFAALKHVRSEKDVFSLLQMLDTNVVRQARFKRWLVERGGCSRYFAVSTDKAANPTSLMGASKRLMEDVVFDVAGGAEMIASTARFANVAFSNGSLLQSFHDRLAARQPLAAPRDTRRYFVTQREAGELCMLAGVLGHDGHIYFPSLDPTKELKLLQDIATQFLNHHGYDAVLFDDETEAKSAVGELSAGNRWPLLLTPLDTSGEKPYEEFVGKDETALDTQFRTLRAIRHSEGRLVPSGILDELERIVGDHSIPVDKPQIVGLMAQVVANLQHVETGRSLDDRA